MADGTECSGNVLSSSEEGKHTVAKYTLHCQRGHRKKLRTLSDGAKRRPHKGSEGDAHWCLLNIFEIEGYEIASFTAL